LPVCSRWMRMIKLCLPVVRCCLTCFLLFCCILLLYVSVVYSVNVTSGHEKECDGFWKRGCKPATEPHVDSQSSDDKTAAWRFARAVHFRFLVNQHVQANAHCHSVAGVMQLWGNQVAQFITIDLSSLKAIDESLEIQTSTMDVPKLSKLAPISCGPDGNESSSSQTWVIGLLKGRFKHPSLLLLMGIGYRYVVFAVTVFCF
jgi:hypothetical protein